MLVSQVTALCFKEVNKWQSHRHTLPLPLQCSLGCWPAPVVATSLSKRAAELKSFTIESYNYVIYSLWYHQVAVLDQFYWGGRALARHFMRGEHLTRYKDKIAMLRSNRD